MTRTALPTLLVVWFFAALAQAAEPQSADDCTKLEQQQALNDCAARVRAATDARLNEVYRSLMRKLAEEDTRKLLRESERAWISYRDKQCTFATSGADRGSIRSLMASFCLTEQTQARIKELERHLTCEEGDVSCVR